MKQVIIKEPALRGLGCNCQGHPGTDGPRGVHSITGTRGIIGTNGTVSLNEWWRSSKKIAKVLKKPPKK